MSALSTAVSGLLAESAALAVISQNLANSSTTGYKASTSSFYDLVYGTSSSTSTGSGVTTVTTQHVDVQGTLESASSTTDLAISGTGFFCVSNGSDGTDVYYTRDGEFTTNASGYLVLSGTTYYLLGYATDTSGNVTSSTLEAINVEKYATSAAATTEVTLKANLPADAQSDTSSYTDGFATTITVYDSLGEAEYLTCTFVPTGDNTWEMTVAGPTDSSGTSTGTITSSATYTVTFNSDGTLASISGGTLDSDGEVEIDISAWTDGASDSTITLDLGTSGSISGLTQYSSGESTPTLSVSSVSQDGACYGTLSSVDISSDGTVYAEYTNGTSVAIYQIAVATFANVNGLLAVSDNVYEATSDAGDAVYTTAGSDGTGTIESGYLEASTTDTTTELTALIVCQQAYSAAAQVISTDKEMFSTLMNVIA